MIKIKCPSCGCTESGRHDVEDPELETCVECGQEFYPSECEDD